MRRQFSGAVRVPYDEAKKRALTALTRHPTPANAIAHAIWPDHQMTSQGAGGAASRILRRMEKEGLAKWRSTETAWGWVRL